MEHRFSKREYFVSCAFTILFSGIVAVAYFDTSTCPYRYNRATPWSMTTSSDNNNNNNNNNNDIGMSTVGHYKYASTQPRSLFSSLVQEGGLTCHMTDLVIWVYIIGLVLFISHKAYHYRIQGLHYFLLDYCYFHNFCLVLFLLWRLVDVQWSEEPLISWETYLPESWQSERISSSINSNSNTGGSSSSVIEMIHDHKGVVTTVTAKVTPFINQTWKSWAQQVIPSTMRQILLVAGIYKPISVDIITIGYAAAEVSTPDDLLLAFLSFFTLVAGSFGPILGAILIWKNALLFHSFDRMSSSYLHLAPAITQVLLLHRLFTTARQELASFDDSSNSTNHSHDHSSSGGSCSNTLQHRLNELCSQGTLCYDLRHAVSYRTLLELHFVMFIAWQIFYHTISESRRVSRIKSHRKRLKELEQRQEELCRLTGATREEAQLLRPILLLSEGLAGDPAHRVTAYTWMWEHPPLGKEGPLYRFVTLFGKGYLPTVIMFQVTQWILHVIFFTLAYGSLYYSFHVAFSAWPLTLYVILFVILCVYNAAVVNKRWIQKLQRLAEIGLAAQRTRTLREEGNVGK
ncbi:uncharacterized protein TM35_000421170 [Trypanosoma theileri]|uniref:Glycerophosphocholine acyltransferase 1 n=1 Tax=Trypanosoma theileri TaxID=67003 RepID=A0A1X0NKF9_9TRYP|nr:uncharacterized protein TM35_000421170 [Trypanosoma theileri]ORC84659.1 hypothetical protein TM35_000421170 [Trypanosoma theileri]